MNLNTFLDLLGDAFSPENISSDLALIVAWVCAAAVSVFLPPLSGTPARVVLALPLVLVIPGYALIAALFPGREDIDTIERFALSLGLSIAVAPLIGLALNYTPAGIRLAPIMIALAAFSVTMAVVAQVRRTRIPPPDRFSFSFRRGIAAAYEQLVPPGESRLDRALSIILILAVAAAVIVTVLVIVMPREGEHFTEFYILGSRGMASDYPETLDPGVPTPLIIGVGNHEYHTVNYTVEVFLFNTTFNPATNLSAVSTTRLIDRFPVTLPHNETREVTRNLTAPDRSGNQVVFLLFPGDVPPDAVAGLERVNASYRDLHLWLREEKPLPASRGQG